MKDTKHLYEGMYILSAQLSDDARAKAFEKIQSEIKELGGEIKNVIEMGRRRLAYEISNHREGYYFLMYFEVNASAINTLWSNYHLNEDLLRFMTLTTEEVKETLEFKELAEQA